jgi:hypothetical protein
MFILILLGLNDNILTIVIVELSLHRFNSILLKPTLTAGFSYD